MHLCTGRRCIITPALTDIVDANNLVIYMAPCENTTVIEYVQLWDHKREGRARCIFENWPASLKWQRLELYEKFAAMIDCRWDGTTPTDRRRTRPRSALSKASIAKPASSGAAPTGCTIRNISARRFSVYPAESASCCAKHQTCGPLLIRRSAHTPRSSRRLQNLTLRYAELPKLERPRGVW